MKKTFFLVMLLSIFFLTTLSVFSAQLTAKPNGPNMWDLYSQDNKLVGSVKKNETNSLSFYDKNGTYIGVIQESGTWVPWNARRRVTFIKPEEARLYLDVLEISKGLK